MVDAYGGSGHKLHVGVVEQVSVAACPCAYDECVGLCHVVVCDVGSLDVYYILCYPIENFSDIWYLVVDYNFHINIDKVNEKMMLF